MITPKAESADSTVMTLFTVTASDQFTGVRKDHETKAITDYLDWVSRVCLVPESSRLRSSALH
jgi:hypothetical protein